MTPNTERAHALALELRCLVCQNQSLADSNAALARDLKQQIDDQIAAGKTDSQIRHYMAERYSDYVLYDPPFNLTNAALWLVPALVVVVGLMAVRRSLSASGTLRNATLGNDAENLPP